MPTDAQKLHHLVAITLLKEGSEGADDYKQVPVHVDGENG